LIDLLEELQGRPTWLLCVSVHDSNLIECPIPDIMDCALFLKSIMEKPRHLWGKDIVFGADVEVSTKSWGEMEPYEEYQKREAKRRKA